MKLSDNIKFIRKENNLSQEQLAEQLGVSRQAVSKWESGQSYPEMDKVLLICKLYNYNIDELMNENVKEVSETKQSKININKYIDDFFEFITKTIDMLSSMKFKQKIKCFMEQVIMAIFLVCVFAVIGIIGNAILTGLIGRLPNNIYYTIRNILASIYMVLAFIIGVTVLLHIFKVRYLDYYEIVKEDDIKESVEKTEDSHSSKLDSEDNKKIVLEKRKEKIIIRDPEHSQSKFLTGIIKFVLWCIKIMAIFIGIGFAFSFVGLVTLLSFLFVKTGLVFFGGLLGIISALIINFLMLQIIYNFIVSKKNHKTKIAILLISSLVLAGLSIGMIFIGATSFNVVEEDNIEAEDEYNIQMTDNLSIGGWDRNIEYVESDSSDVKIVVKHSKRYKTSLENENDIIYVFSYTDDIDFMNMIRDIIKDINNKEIKSYNYDNLITVYTSKENIEKLKQNKQIQYERSRDSEIENLNNENTRLENNILELENKLEEQESTIEEQKLELEEKKSEIKSLQEEFNSINE